MVAKTQQAKGLFVQMVYERDTPGTFVFKAELGSPIPVLYIKKQGFGGKPPKQITVNVNVI